MSQVCSIVQLGAASLRQQAQWVEDIDTLDTQEAIAAMQITLANTQGVGLAAPQINIDKRIIIVASRPTARYPKAPLMEPVVMINPSYRACSDSLEKDWEGCLSIPSIRALVPRYQTINITFTNQQGELKNQNLEGFVARVFQHEYDHLEGLVYLDRVETSLDIFSETEYFKLLESEAN